MASFSYPHFQLSSTQTAVALVVPLHLQSEINSLRSIYDKAFHKWKPHINILYPFVEPMRLSSAVITLRETLRERHVERLSVNIDEVGVFKNRRNATVFLKPDIESENSICQLRKILVKTLGRSERDGTHDGTFRPHLTVGQAALTGNSLERLTEEVGKLLGLHWESITLAVLKRESSGEMIMVEELPLGDLLATRKDREFSEWRPCFSFEPNIGWVPNELRLSHPAIPAPLEVTVATYNLMAGSTAPSFTSRLQPIIEAISSTSLSISSNRVLCLQEVNNEMLPLILAEQFIQDNFPFSTHLPSSLLPSHRNLVTLTSRPFESFLLRFAERHKTALIIAFSNSHLKIANIHLTSALSDQAVQVKKVQMETLTNFLTKGRNATEKEILIAGDFNLTTSSRTLETAVSQAFITSEAAQMISRVVNPKIWEDTFNLSCPHFRDFDRDIFEGEEGATFDRLTNHLAAMSESPIDNRPQRYDRVLYRKGGSFSLGTFEMFGLPMGQGSFASDHYGVCVTLRFVHNGDIRCNPNIPAPSLLPTSDIEVAEDLTDLRSLLQLYLPTAEDQEQRFQALERLQQAITSNQSTVDLVFAPLGSYFMGTYFGDSDVDLLAIGSVAPQVFFDIATTQLQALDARGDNGFKGVHFVNSLVSVVEVSVLGIKFDLQYCQAVELVERYHSSKSPPNLADLVFDKRLISALAPSSLRPLNTYRDMAFLLKSLPDVPSYRVAHRFLSLYLKRRGLYSAKFGYLGGIHLSLMLNRVVKLIAASSNEQSAPDLCDISNVNISPATIVRTFFAYYATFKWAEDSITDPSLPNHRNATRSPRDAIFIYSIHTPTARPNVASSCTRLTAQTLTREFSLAVEKLRAGEWQWCFQAPVATINDFMNGFGAFVKIQTDMWDLDEIGGEKVREMVGRLESKFPRLMVAFGRVAGLDGRLWPSRFRDAKDGGGGLKGYYLAGVSSLNKEMDPQEKRLFTSKVFTAVAEFEKSVKGAEEFEGENLWISIEVVTKKKILEMNMVVDERDWGQIEGL